MVDREPTAAYRRTLEVWAEVLESCLPTDEGYDDDTEQVLNNVIRSIRREIPDQQGFAGDPAAAHAALSMDGTSSMHPSMTRKEHIMTETDEPVGPETDPGPLPDPLPGVEPEPEPDVESDEEGDDDADTPDDQ